MFSEERREIILKLLKEQKRVEVKDLVERFQVSIDSIRRDLRILESEGLLKRTHGGAIETTPIRIEPAASSERYGDGSPNQHQIVQKAATYITKNSTVFIGGASTHYILHNYLPKDFSITVVTNSIRVADALRERGNIECIMIGGRVKNSGNITDPIAIEFIKQFHFDIAFLTGGGLSENGLSTNTPEAALLMRTVSKQAKYTICLMVGEKVGIDSFVKIIPLEEMDRLITNQNAREKVKNWPIVVEVV